MESPALFAPLVASLLAAARGLSPAAVAAVLDDSVDRHGVDATVDEVVFPALRLVGLLWAANRLDVAHEHVLTGAVSRWVRSRTSEQPQPVRGNSCRAMLAVGPSDQHTLGLECFELLLVSRGATVFNLGTSVPTDSLILSATALSPDAVVVCAHNPTASSDAVRAVIQLHAAGYATYFAGAAFASQFVRRRSPGTPLDATLSASADSIVSHHGQATSEPLSQRASTVPV